MEFDAADARGVAREGGDGGGLREGPEVDISFPAAGGEVDAVGRDGCAREGRAGVPGYSSYTIRVAS